MNKNTFLAVIAGIAIVIAVANISITLFKIPDLKGLITGQATGVLNLTILEVVEINVSNSSIEWGHGRINSGQANATLNTSQDNAATVTRGNWSVEGVSAIKIDNYGNVNCSVTLQAGLNASLMFGSRSGDEGATNPNEEYKWMVSEFSAASCSGGDIPLLEWWDVNSSASGEEGKACDDLSYETGSNSIYLDIWLTIPWDSANTTSDGSRPIQDTITITGAAT